MSESFKYYTNEHVDALKPESSDKVTENEGALVAGESDVVSEAPEIGAMDSAELLKINRNIDAMDSSAGNMLKGKFLKNLREGEYSLIIGDDTSGRIPTLIFGRIASKMAKDVQRPAPKVRFVAGTISVPDEYTDTSQFGSYQKKLYELTDYFAKLIDQENIKNEKVLLVTDTIDSGNTMMGFVSALKANGIKCDIATLSLFRASPFNRKTAESLKRKKEAMLNGCKIYYSDKGDTPGIYRDKLSSGIVKDPYVLHASPAKTDLSNVPPHLKNQASAQNIQRSKYAAYARARAFLIADELYERKKSK